MFSICSALIEMTISVLTDAVLGFFNFVLFLVVSDVGNNDVMVCWR